ncbi:AAA domain-containing protein [Angustibacter sp. Root456]|uniref:AAA domain-containing protein n=1 Tax=Angustibacter sp. Root456 TaxID=1736539 RepID=UPI0009EC5287|nr:AAA domain-containing protein [Angustibacter sp. Root456]
MSAAQFDGDPPGDDAPAAPTRAERVRTAVDAWRRELVDLGGRNTLLFYRDLAVGTLDLTHAHPSGLAMLLAGRPTRLSTLVREAGTLADARRRARAIRAKTLELAEERGIQAGWLAVGMATWHAPDAARPPAAPVLLRACTLRPRGAAGEDFDIDLGPAAELNPVLVHYLENEHGVRLDADVIADLALSDDGFDPRPVLERVAETCRDVPGFSVEHRLVIGTFSYARLPMVTDLEAQRDTLAEHDVVAALAGDPEAITAVAGVTGPPAAGDADPAAEHLVLDADASQQAVVDAVLAGSHLVVKGPPGTGKSQTIANLIASLAASGRRTLFVAEKRAAIDAVLSRLAAVGLDDLVLDLHDGASNRRRVARDIALTLERAGRVARPDVETTMSTLVERRGRLTGHLAALHERREPWGVSAFAAQQALAALTERRPAPRSRIRVRGAALESLDRVQLDVLREELREAASLGAFRAGPDDDPWFGAHLATSEEAQEALEKVTTVSQQALPHARYAMSTLLEAAGMPGGRTLSDYGRALSLIGSVRATLDVFTPQVFDTSLADAVAATATSQWRAERGIDLGWMQRRRLARQARKLLRPGKPPQDLHAALALAHRQREEWQALAGPGARPQLPPGLDAAEVAYLDVAEPVEWLSERLADTAAGGDLAGVELDVLAARLELMTERTASLPVIPRTVRLRERLRDAGLEPLLADLAARDVAAADVGSELDLVWWTSLLEHIAVTDPRYGAHDGELLREVGAEFAAADRDHVTSGAQRVRRATAERLVAALDRHPEQAALLRSEAAKQRRHRPLRDLVDGCPDVLGAAKPCWALSPLVVSQVLPPGERFDVVVFDEASQVPPAQAVPALSRGRQVVVAGDERQLPPTSFFTSAVPDDGPSDAQSDAQSEPFTDGFESVLDALSATLPVAQLRWHYRSRDERLVAFANRHVYDDGLVTFPGSGDGPVLTLEEVDGRGVLAPDSEAVDSTQAEVDRVVELVLEHARTRPDESLGVIALGLRHAHRVDDALRLALAAEPALADFFADDRPERFFVKNLERVQGDERDAIILTIGYGRTPHGRVLHRFGPLNQAGGERRLNVAVTRARSRMSVVSSFGAADLDPARLTAEGARLLRAYLAYAASGGQVLDEAPTERTHDAGRVEVADDALLADLAARLRAQDLRVEPAYGASWATIDLAVGPADGPLVVAVEADGPAYARVANSRERDRLRPEQLERLGWRHLRVWSTDVFRDPAREVARIRAAVERAVADRRTGRAAVDLAAPQVRWDLDSHDAQLVGALGSASVGGSGRAGARPRVPAGRPIDEYSEAELDAVVAWICSDTLLRTHDDVAALTRQHLGLARRGSRIDAAIDAAIERVQGAGA